MKGRERCKFSRSESREDELEIEMALVIYYSFSNTVINPIVISMNEQVITVINGSESIARKVSAWNCRAELTCSHAPGHPKFNFIFTQIHERETFSRSLSSFKLESEHIIPSSKIPKIKISNIFGGFGYEILFFIQNTRKCPSKSP